MRLSKANEPARSLPIISAWLVQTNWRASCTEKSYFQSSISVPSNGTPSLDNWVKSKKGLRILIHDQNKKKLLQPPMWFSKRSLQILEGKSNLFPIANLILTTTEFASYSYDLWYTVKTSSNEPIYNSWTSNNQSSITKYIFSFTAF